MTKCLSVMWLDLRGLPGMQAGARCAGRLPEMMAAIDASMW